MNSLSSLKPNSIFKTKNYEYEVLDKDRWIFVLNKTTNKIEKFSPYTTVRKLAKKNKVGG